MLAFTQSGGRQSALKAGTLKSRPAPPAQSPKAAPVLPAFARRAISSPATQPRMTINRPGDSMEREADRVSDRVMRQSTRSHEPLQTQRANTSGAGQGFAPPIVHEVVRSPGQPLDPATREFMGPRMGHDFSQVRVHSGSLAHQSARAVDANAYTVGNHLVFAGGKFAPQSSEGKSLLAHELAHVMQQQTSSTAATTLQRQPAGQGQSPPTGQPPATAADITFTVGSANAQTAFDTANLIVVTPAFAAAAKTAVAGASAGLADVDLLKLRTAALANDQSVDDNERMLMAALMDATNVTTLKGLPFGNGQKVHFPIASVTSANRTHIENLGRPGMPANVVAEGTAALNAAKAWDLPGATAHLAAMESNAAANVELLAGTKRPIAHIVLARAAAAGVKASFVLSAMLNAASDSTPDDMTFAGALYVIACEIKSPLADDILSGKIKVDAVPQASLGNGAWASYQAVGGAGKGDTVYLPQNFDITDIGHRSQAVHELHHAATDKASPGPQPQTIARAEEELKAYREQSQWLLKSLVPLTGRDYNTAVTQISHIWNPLLAIAMCLEARGDVKAIGFVSDINHAAPATDSAPFSVLSGWLHDPVSTVEADALARIHTIYSIPASNHGFMNGLTGPSLLDRI